MRNLLLLVMVAALLGSCAPLRPQRGPAVDKLFAEALVRDWRAGSGPVESIKGLAKVTVDAPLNHVNGTQVVLAQWPNKLRSETLSPFGAPLFLLTSDGQRLGASLPAQNLYYIAAATPENLGQFVNIPLELDDLVGVLLYQPPLLEAWEQEAFELEGGGWLLIRRGTLRRQELIFNAARQLVDVSFYEDKDLVARVAYREFTVQPGGGTFPQHYTLDLPEKHATITLAFSDLETNGQIRAGLFEVVPPAGARVVYLPD